MGILNETFADTTTSLSLDQVTLNYNTEATFPAEVSLPAANDAVQPITNVLIASTVPAYTQDHLEVLGGHLEEVDTAAKLLNEPYRNIGELIKRINSLEGAVNELDQCSRELTYRSIAKVLEVIYRAFDPTDTETLKDLLCEAERRQVNLEVGSSKFDNQIVRMFWGKFNILADRVKVNGILYTKWEPSRSAEKNALVLRHLRRKAVKPEDAVAYISKFVDTSRPSGNGRRKLYGIVDYETQQKPTVKRVINNSPKDEGDGLKLVEDETVSPIASLPRPSSVTQTSGLIFLVGRIVKGELELIGELDLDRNHDVVKGAISRLARSKGIPCPQSDEAIANLKAEMSKAA